MANPLSISYNFLVVLDNNGMRMRVPFSCCSLCGALVSEGWTYKHTVWHEVNEGTEAVTI